MTKTYLKKRLRYWQKRLGLSDWKISVEFRNNLPNGVEATIQYQFNRKRAILVVLHPNAYFDLDSPFRQDLDHAIVHELLHILFAPFSAEPDSIEEVLQEQVISTIANALCQGEESLP